jgi:hypothetical protein
VLIREARGTPARAFARFGAPLGCFSLSYTPDLFILRRPERGEEKHVELENLAPAEVEKKISQLLS